ncbi:MAG: hypothetical protein GC154_00920 [bacterium]|nr:hypothetical protein [bacterium]
MADNALAIEAVIKRIEAIPGFSWEDIAHGRYRHIGATLTDLVLHSLLKYPSQVKPAAQRLLDEYPDAAHTTPLIEEMEAYSPKYFLNLTDAQAARRVYALAKFLREEGIETEIELHDRVFDPHFVKALKKQRGTGNHDVDYLALLAGREAMPVDDRMTRLLEESNIAGLDYAEAQRLFMKIAEALNQPPRRFYLNLWYSLAGYNK